VLDAEVAIFDQQLHSRFDWLRGQPDELATTPIFIAFDVLYRAVKDVPKARSAIAVSFWKLPLLAEAPTFCWPAVSPPTAWMPGRGCSAAAGRATWRRTNSARIVAVSRAHGSR
jgi:hypothetical protein